jgi:hypothetical protein
MHTHEFENSTFPVTTYHAFLQSGPDALLERGLFAIAFLSEPQYLFFVAKDSQKHD